MSNLTPGKLRISRPTSQDKSWIEIDLSDTTSKERITAKISLEQFAQAVTGLSVDCEIELPANPANLGLKRDSMRIEVPVNDRNKVAAMEAIESATPEGWFASAYLGSKDSFITKKGQLYAVTTAYRWVEQ